MDNIGTCGSKGGRRNSVAPTVPARKSYKWVATVELLGVGCRGEAGRCPLCWPGEGADGDTVLRLCPIWRVAGVAKGCPTLPLPTPDRTVVVVGVGDRYGALAGVEWMV